MRTIQPTEEMRETYEAVLDDDRLEWAGRRPGAGRHRVLVTLLDPPARDPDEVLRILGQTRGAWSTANDLEEIDDKIEEMRSEWDRPWDEARGGQEDR